MLPGLAPVLVRSRVPTTLLAALTALGLTSGLRICLDAGDIASIPSGSATKWLDTSGGGFDFFRGTSTSSESTDPSINGTPGNKSNAEYLGFDGGDILQYDTTNEAFMDNFHKNNGAWTAFCWYWPGSLTGGGSDGTDSPLLLTRNTSSQVGVKWRLDPSGHPSLLISTGTAGNQLANTMTATAVLNKWNFIGVSHDEATGAGGQIHVLNGTVESFASAVTSPSAAASAVVAKIGGLLSTQFFPSGSRLAMWAAFEPLAMSSANLLAIYNATRGRFGV